MSFLPNADKAVIAQEKLTGYLLSSDHTSGKPKAAFFKRFGYHKSNWRVIENDLRELIFSQHIQETKKTQFGTKYIITGPIISPSGETIQVLTVWVILDREDFPRFITAYPGEKYES